MTKFHRSIDHVCAHSNDAAHSVEISAGACLLFTNGQVLATLRRGLNRYQ